MPPSLDAAARFGIAYRSMTEDDLAFIEALYASTRADEIGLTGLPVEQQRALLAQQHQAQHHHYRTYYPDAEWLIVERGGQPIGRLYLDRRNGWHIIDISLIPAARGLGMGRAIITDIIAAAESEGRGVSIHVELRNPARRLYERLGFELAEDKGIYLRMERPARAA